MTGSAAVIVLWMVALIAYLVPSIVAEERNSKKLHPIIIVNVFLGWTVIGWIIAMKWACEPKHPPAVAEAG
jgi:uncharacterized sodium:solute symporter family permease YidK